MKLKLMRPGALKDSQGRHRDPTPWTWQERKDPQVQKEEHQPQQEQHVLPEETASAAAAAAAVMVDVTENDGGATFRHQVRHRSRRGPAGSRSQQVLPGAGCRNLGACGTRDFMCGPHVHSVGTAVSCGTKDSNTPFSRTFASRRAAQIHEHAARCEETGA
eukprot:350202-Chlamydomonas_euryale.AAC.1